MIQGVLAVAAAMLAGGSAAPPIAQPLYQPPGSWVQPIPIPLKTPASGASADLLLYTAQERFTAASDENFVETAVRINAPEGLLQVGNIIETWNPLTESLTIHHARIVRAGKEIDLLAGGRAFTVLRRESNLEAAMIDGELTATLQPAGLQVGDILDVAYTLKRHEPALAGRSEATLLLAHNGVASRLVVRAAWPQDHPMRLWETDDIGPLPIHDARGWREIDYDLKDAVSVQSPEGAPLRDQLRGIVQFSGFKDWPDLSASAYLLYDRAAALRTDSPLKTEIARLRAASTNPKARALAALQLVEDKVRYLYVGLDAGGYTPAAADETWTRRFGDCKGKTVLLLALLRGLGIPAEPVLVNSQAGDGMDRRLPQMAAFDHVLIRAEIDGRAYWLDGTRLDDANLDILRTPNLHWALPLRAKGASLEPLTPDPLVLPQVDKELRVDLGARIDKPAPAHMEIVMRDDPALALNLVLKQASAADADRALRKLFEDNESWIKADKVSFAYDPLTGVARMTMDGSGVVPFTGGDGDKEWWIDLSSVGWDADFRRNTPYHANAPFAVDFPQFQRTTVEVALPADGHDFNVGNGEAVNQTTAGRAYSRAAAVNGGRLTMTWSFRTVSPEFPASEAPAAQQALHELSVHDVVLRYMPAAPSEKTSTAPPTSAAATGPAPLLGDRLSDRERAVQEFSAKDYAAAEADFTHAITQEPSSSKLLYDRGAATLALGRRPAARADFEAALKLNPKDAFALFALGRLALATNDLPLAAQRFKDAVAVAADPQTMMKDVGDAYQEANRHAEARRYYDQWTAADTNPITRSYEYNELCWSEALAGSALKQAKDYCDKAIALNKTYFAAFDSRGFVELRMGAFDASKTDYDKALALAPDHSSSLFGRGVAELRLGHQKEAAADLDEARRLDSKIEVKFAKWGVKP